MGLFHPQVFSRLWYPIVRQGALTVLSHMLLSFQHSPEAFHLVRELVTIISFWRGHVVGYIVFLLWLILLQWCSSFFWPQPELNTAHPRMTCELLKCKAVILISRHYACPEWRGVSLHYQRVLSVFLVTSQVVPHVVHLTQSLRTDGLPNSKAFLLQFTELIHCMMYQYSGFPDLYDNILEAIKVKDFCHLRFCRWLRNVMCYI